MEYTREQTEKIRLSIVEASNRALLELIAVTCFGLHKVHSESGDPENLLRVFECIKERV